MIKICKKCQGKSIQKFGKTDGRQRYKCVDCGYIFRNSRRTSRSATRKNHQLFLDYSFHKQTLAELADTEKVCLKTIHRKLSKEFISKIQYSKEQDNIRLSPNLSQYTSSVLILDATFFGRKGSESQW